MLRFDNDHSHEVCAKTIFGRQSLIVSQDRRTAGGVVTLQTPPADARFKSFNDNIYTNYKPRHSINRQLPKLRISREDQERLSQPQEKKPLYQIPIIRPGKEVLAPQAVTFYTHSSQQSDFMQSPPKSIIENFSRGSLITSSQIISSPQTQQTPKFQQSLKRKLSPCQTQSQKESWSKPIYKRQLDHQIASEMFEDLRDKVDELVMTSTSRARPQPHLESQIHSSITSLKITPEHSNPHNSSHHKMINFSKTQGRKDKRYSDNELANSMTTIERQIKRQTFILPTTFAKIPLNQSEFDLQLVKVPKTTKVAQMSSNQFKNQDKFGHAMTEAKNQISSIRRISANIFAPISESQPHPLEMQKLKPIQFTGALDLLKYKPVTLTIDVSGCRLPIHYTFIYPPSGEFNVWFSTKKKPSEGKCEQALVNKQQLTYEIQGQEKLKKNSTHYLTFEACFDGQVFLGFQQNLQKGTNLLSEVKEELIVQQLEPIQQNEIFQKLPGETVIQMVERLTNRKDEKITKQLAQVDFIEQQRIQKMKETKQLARQRNLKYHTMLSREHALLFVQSKREQIDFERKKHLEQYLAHSENRRDLRQKILDAVISKRQAELRLKRICAFTILRNCLKRQKAELIRRLIEKSFLKKAGWIAIKIWIKSRVRIRRYAATADQRLRLHIKNSLRVITDISIVDATEQKAGKLIHKFFKESIYRKNLKSLILNQIKDVRKIQAKAKCVLQVRDEQQSFILQILDRERLRICVKLKSKQFQPLIDVLNRVPEYIFKDLVREYYTKCNNAHDVEFKQWRHQIKYLKQQGLEDVMDGWHYPYLRSRVVTSFEAINFENALTPLHLKHQEKITKVMLTKYEYHLNNSWRDNHLMSQSNKKEEQLCVGNQIYFPVRPAQKFIPSTEISHQLILMAIIRADPQFTGKVPVLIQGESMSKSFDEGISKQ